MSKVPYIVAPPCNDVLSENSSVWHMLQSSFMCSHSAELRNEKEWRQDVTSYQVPYVLMDKLV
jgi:hypothetical protein